MSEDGIFCRVVEYEISWPIDLKDRIKNKEEIYRKEDKTSPF